MTGWTIRRVKGDHMTGGYTTDLASGSMLVAVSATGELRACNIEGRPDFLESPLTVDADGLLVHTGALPGHGFLPKPGEMERIGAQTETAPA